MLMGDNEWIRRTRRLQRTSGRRAGKLVGVTLSLGCARLPEAAETRR